MGSQRISKDFQGVIRDYFALILHSPFTHNSLMFTCYPGIRRLINSLPPTSGRAASKTRVPQPYNSALRRGVYPSKGGMSAHPYTLKVSMHAHINNLVTACRKHALRVG